MLLFEMRGAKTAPFNIFVAAVKYLSSTEAEHRFFPPRYLLFFSNLSATWQTMEKGEGTTKSVAKN